jgi:hypothetical protein
MTLDLPAHLRDLDIIINGDSPNTDKDKVEHSCGATTC